IEGDLFGLLALCPVVVVDEAEQGRLDVIAEAALCGVGVPEPALQKAHGELLSEFLGEVGVADDLGEIAVDRPAVTEHEGAPCLDGGVVRALVGLKEHGPLRGDLAEVLVTHGGPPCSILRRAVGVSPLVFGEKLTIPPPSPLPPPADGQSRCGTPAQSAASPPRPAPRPRRASPARSSPAAPHAPRSARP